MDFTASLHSTLYYFNSNYNRLYWILLFITALLMDYIFIVNFGWYVIELYLNVRLQLTKIKVRFFF